MLHISLKTTAITLSAALALAIGTSCSNDKKPESAAKPAAAGSPITNTMHPGEAGGSSQESYTMSATVTGVEPSIRKVSLRSDDGTEADVFVGPNVQNFDQ